MSWTRIRLILAREIRDQLRDRRTLFMIAVFPLLLYPGIGIGMVQMTVLFTEQPRTVVVLGAKNLPAHPPLLEKNRVVSNWFDLAADAEKLEIITDDLSAASDGSGADPHVQELLEQARRIRDQLAVIEEFDELLRAPQVDRDEIEKQSFSNGIHDAQTEQAQSDARSKLAKSFEQSHIQVLIIVPPEFGNNIEKMNREIAEQKRGAKDIPDYERPVIVRNSADEKSMIAYRRVKEAMTSWERAILKQRLATLDLPQSLPSPIGPTPIDLAADEQLAANLWSKLFPALLVIMSVTGAFYPAVDLAAGEKERGTMETLLICPATRGELVVGKFLTVMFFSTSTALLNIAVMGLTGKYLASIAGSGAFSKIGDLTLPPPISILWVVILLIPLAALFSALCLALATFARSSKEGQYYLTPLLMVTMGLTIFCLSPAVEIEPFYSVMPVVGPTLLLKELLASPGNTDPIIYALPVLITSIGYSLLALWWAIEQFDREDVLFREAERFELGLWVRHLLRDKEPTPSFIEAGFCFIFIMFMQFGAMKLMRDAIGNAAPQEHDLLFMKLLMIQQLAIIVTPALLMAAMLTTSIISTFRLRWPGWKMLAVAIVLPFALHPLSRELLAHLDWFFKDLPESVTSGFAVMSDKQQPLWLVMLTFAAVPAVCEELAFRGFILSGFSRSRRAWLAVVLSSLAFGIIHVIPQQVFNATLLGLVLGLIAIRSNSLLPCVIFHAIYNSLQITTMRIDTSQFDGSSFNWLAVVDNDVLRYQWPTLAAAAAVAIVLLSWVARQSAAVSHGGVGNVGTGDSEHNSDGSVAAKPPVRAS
jgi:sodium transport system permease protein